MNLITWFIEMLDFEIIQNASGITWDDSIRLYSMDVLKIKNQS